MTIPLGSATLTVNTPGTFRDAPAMGIQGLVIGNESPFTVAIQMQGTARGGTLYPETVDFFPVDRGFTGVVSYSPTSVITNPASYTAATLDFQAVGLSEPFNQSQYPMALTRAAVNPTATGNPLFSASVGFGSTVGIKQILNIFNPANSGLNYIFHAARCFTNDSSLPTVNLAVISGADNNLSTAVSAVCHTLQKNPPVSTAHCTAVDQNSGIIGSNPIVEVMDQQQDVTQDMLAFPDVVTLTPGNNLVFELSAGGTGKIVRLTLKWEEGVAIPAPSLASIPLLTASTVVNDNSPAGVGLIEASVSGTQNVFIDTSGNATFGGNEDIEGTFNVDGAATVGGALNALVSLITNLITNVSGNNLLIKALGASDQVQFLVNSVKFLQVDNAGVGFKTVGHIGAGFQMIAGTSIANAGTSVAHSLGVIPTVVIPVHDTGGASADVISINYGTMSSTNFTAYSSNAGGSANVRFFVLA